MKKILAILLSVSAFLMMSCSSESDNSAKTEDPASIKPIKICLYGASEEKDWNIWPWKENGSDDINYCTSAWPGELSLDHKDTEKGYVYRILNVDTNYDLGIVVIDSEGGSKTADINVPKDVLLNYDELYFPYGVSKYYTSFEAAKGLQAAKLSDPDGCHIALQITDHSLVDTSDLSSIVVKDSTGATLTLISVSIDENVNVVVSDGDISKIPYKVTFKGVEVTTSIPSSLIDDIYNYTGNDLGISFSSKSSVTFKTWSPLATSVKVLLYTDVTNVTKKEIAKTETMTMDLNGVWSTAAIDCSEYSYYKYRFEFADSVTYDVCDIWAKSASPDSVASQIIDINTDSTAIETGIKDTSWGTKESYYNPFGNVVGNTVESNKTYTEAILYEMHIRDWSKGVDSNSEGKFLTLANSDKFIEHLIDIGITHVQLLPCFDYAQLNSDKSYNWGYNPYNYNVPEGRYVVDMTNGADAVKQFRKLISKLHDNGIAVVMDVVYNHTSGTNTGSLYDMTVPSYFYRYKADGSVNDGSGCGNETNTNNKMVRKFVIDSLKHWMLDYHINGFRFDLMGIHEKNTMKEIYDALYVIDPNVMVYGEPWDCMGKSIVEDGVNLEKDALDKCSSSDTINGVGAFNDKFRNGLRGDGNDASKAHVQGNYSDDAIINGLIGSPNITKVPGRSLNYVECHDNLTLFDKLAKSNGYSVTALTSKQLTAICEQEKLTAAFIFLSQGTPFINGGQEFCRTKKGDHNSYKSADSINAIDLTRKEKANIKDVYNTYKGLIALRKSSLAFTKGTDFSAEKIEDGVTKYVTGNFLVYFNATNADAAITTSGYTKVVDVTSGTPTESTTVPTTVQAKSFVILKR